MASSKKKIFSAEEVLRGLFTDPSQPLSRGFQMVKLSRDWAQVVGEEIAAYTYPICIKGKCLFAWVKHSTAQSHLIFFTPQVVIKINDYFGEKWVEKIFWTNNSSKLPTLTDKQTQELKEMIQRFE